jgi:hypothetical protein
VSVGIATARMAPCIRPMAQGCAPRIEHPSNKNCNFGVMALSRLQPRLGIVPALERRGRSQSRAQHYPRQLTGTFGPRLHLACRYQLASRDIQNHEKKQRQQLCHSGNELPHMIFRENDNKVIRNLATVPERPTQRVRACSARNALAFVSALHQREHKLACSRLGCRARTT